MTTEREELLTPTEVAAELKTTVETVRHWLRTGVLPGLRIGPRQWRVKRSDLVKFVEAAAP